MLVSVRAHTSQRIRRSSANARLAQGQSTAEVLCFLGLVPSSLNAANMSSNWEPGTDFHTSLGFQVTRCLLCRGGDVQVSKPSPELQPQQSSPGRELMINGDSGKERRGACHGTPSFCRGKFSQHPNLKQQLESQFLSTSSRAAFFCSVVTISSSPTIC